MAKQHTTPCHSDNRSSRFTSLPANGTGSPSSHVSSLPRPLPILILAAHWENITDQKSISPDNTQSAFGYSIVPFRCIVRTYLMRLNFKERAVCDRSGHPATPHGNPSTLQNVKHVRIMTSSTAAIVATCSSSTSSSLFHSSCHILHPHHNQPTSSPNFLSSSKTCFPIHHCYMVPFNYCKANQRKTPHKTQTYSRISDFILPNPFMAMLMLLLVLIPLPFLAILVITL